MAHILIDLSLMQNVLFGIVECSMFVFSLYVLTQFSEEQ